MCVGPRGVGMERLLAVSVSMRNECLEGSSSSAFRSYSLLGSQYVRCVLYVLPLRVCVRRHHRRLSSFICVLDGISSYFIQSMCEGSVLYY